MFFHKRPYNSFSALIISRIFWTKKLSSKFIRFQEEFTNIHFPCDQHRWDLNPTFGIEIEMCCHINIYFMGKWWDNDLSDFCDKRTQWVKIISERVFLFENFNKYGAFGLLFNNNYYCVRIIKGIASHAWYEFFHWVLPNNIPNIPYSIFGPSSFICCILLKQFRFVY